MRLIKFRTGWTLKFKKYQDYVNRECTLCDMHGCMSECVICNHPRADGRIAVCCLKLTGLCGFISTASLIRSGDMWKNCYWLWVLCKLFN